MNGPVSPIFASLIGLALVIAVVGCGDEGGSAASGVAEAGGASRVPTAPPEVEVPEEEPPTELVINELQEGAGKEAQKGDEVAIHYYGVQWRDGTEHANSWRYGNAPTFTLGSHQLLRGLNLTVRGMKEGGGREVLIPHTLVYYPDAEGGRSNSLTPEDALVYKVYLLKVLKKGQG